ncbi:DNA mismatch endonuclease (patch repair protein) [Rhizobium rhizoryzae]|uniref:DNA mismatch endonuclease (Patch repair protein) n=1 Tax=Rhizobium rhizoryzae TaxID=451876 RepID=A0A7W6LF60_9HYPH|nr:DNA mismatch endonuclease (patch repair protein) [Rhizobium rhizoryzae]
MADILSQQERSALMARIKGKDTKPEMLVRRGLFRKGYRFRLHRQVGLSRPDIVLGPRKVAIFIHGCFWHQHDRCRHYRLPKSNIEFWRGKLSKNSLRDRQNVEALHRAGWRVALIWECGARDPDLIEELSGWIDRTQSFFVASEAGGLRSVELIDNLELPPTEK